MLTMTGGPSYLPTIPRPRTLDKGIGVKPENLSRWLFIASLPFTLFPRVLSKVSRCRLPCRAKQDTKVRRGERGGEGGGQRKGGRERIRIMYMGGGVAQLVERRARDPKTRSWNPACVRSTREICESVSQSITLC